MFRLISTIAVIAPLLAGCETSDWMAEPDEYSPAYTSSDSSASPNYDPNASNDQFMEHERAVNRENCAAAYEGRDRVCYD